MIDKLSNDVTKASTEVKALLDLQADELKAHGGTLTETSTRLQKAEDNYNKLMKDIEDVQTEMKELQAQGKRLNYGQDELKSVGESFVNSEVYKSAMANGLHITNAMNVKSFFGMEQKDLTTSSVAPLIEPLRIGMLARNQVLRIRDLMNVATLNTGAIEYIQEKVFTNNAAPVAEKDLKPQSNISFEQQTATAKTIAHWIPATKQAIEDAQMLQNFINTRLIDGLKDVEDAQILYGSGTGEDLQGLMLAEGVQDAGASGSKTSLDHIRHALTLNAMSGYRATGIILNPLDWEQIELAKGTDGHYIFVSVNNGAESRLFRVPVVETPRINVGDFLTGAFGVGAQLLDREQANVRISESHADFFVRNQYAIRAEERIAMPIYRPQSFVKGTFGTVAQTETFEAKKHK